MKKMFKSFTQGAANAANWYAKHFVIGTMSKCPV